MNNKQENLKILRSLCKTLRQSELGKRVLNATRSYQYNFIIYKIHELKYYDKLFGINNSSCKNTVVGFCCLDKDLEYNICVKQNDHGLMCQFLVHELTHLLCRNAGIKPNYLYEEILARYISNEVMLDIDPTLHKSLEWEIADTLTNSDYNHCKHEYYYKIDQVLNRKKLKTPGHDVFEQILKRRGFNSWVPVIVKPLY